MRNNALKKYKSKPSKEVQKWIKKKNKTNSVNGKMFTKI